MNIKALKAFRIVAAGGKLANAADKLHLSQPAVSRLISSLEAELHLTLFDRSNRNLTPTSQGLAFYREAGRILDNLDEIPRIAADIRAGHSEGLRIISMPRISQALTSPAVAKFIAQHPNTHVSLDVRARRESSRWLVGNEYDIGVGALPVNHPDIETQAILRSRALAIMPKDHKLAQCSEISVEQLAGEPIIRLMPGLLLRDQLDDIFSSAGIVPQQTCEVSSSQVACQLVAEGAGITIADQLIANAIKSDNLVMRPIIPQRWMTIGLLFPKDRSCSITQQHFVELIYERVKLLAQENSYIEVITLPDKLTIDSELK